MYRKVCGSYEALRGRHLGEDPRQGRRTYGGSKNPSTMASALDVIASRQNQPLASGKRGTRIMSLGTSRRIWSAI
jgi:hypothetical protein